MSWAVVGVVCVALVAFALVMRLVFIHEARKAFSPMDSGLYPLHPLPEAESVMARLDSILASLDRTHGHIQRAGLCVDDQAAPEGGRSEAGA